MVMMVAEQPDFKRYPLRGIMVEVAKERGMTRQAIQKAFRNGNPVIVEAVLKRMQQIDLMQREIEHLAKKLSKGGRNKA